MGSRGSHTSRTVRYCSGCSIWTHTCCTRCSAAASSHAAASSNDTVSVPSCLRQLGMSKTPISKHLAAAGVYVANYPLVKNCAIPEALQTIDPKKVVALSIRADVLLGIRQERAYKWGMSASDPFIDYDVCACHPMAAHRCPTKPLVCAVQEIEEEVRWVKREYRAHPGWRIVNVTDRYTHTSAYSCG
jgi:hypothetical protein